MKIIFKVPKNTYDFVFHQHASDVFVAAVEMKLQLLLAY